MLKDGELPKQISTLSCEAKGGGSRKMEGVDESKGRGCQTSGFQELYGTKSS